MRTLGSNYTKLVEAVEIYESLNDMYDQEGISADEAILNILEEDDSAMLDQLDIDDILDCADIILHEDRCNRYLGGAESLAVEQLATSILETKKITGKSLVNEVLKALTAMPEPGFYAELLTTSQGTKRCVEEICGKAEQKLAKEKLLMGNTNIVSSLHARSVRGRGSMRARSKRKCKSRRQSRSKR